MPVTSDPRPTLSPASTTTSFDQIKKVVAELAAEVESTPPEQRAPLLEKLAQSLKAVSDSEKAQAEIHKVSLEAEKASLDLKQSEERERLDRRQKLIAILTPILTTLVLGLTLAFQTFQFVQSQRDKELAAEDARWSDAVKSVSEGTKLSPVAVTLNPFLRSTRYSERARQLTVQVLGTTSDRTLFAELFRGALTPVEWSNLDAVLRLDRALIPRYEPMLGRLFDAKTRTDIPSRLTEQEQRDLQYIRGALTEISASVAPLLKSRRPTTQTLDLHGTWFTNCDWRGVDLSNADITGMVLRYVDLSGANLSNITTFGYPDFYATAWWRAERISPELLDHLIRRWPHDPTMTYGSKFESLTKKEYDEALVRLRGNP